PLMPTRFSKRLNGFVCELLTQDTSRLRKNRGQTAHFARGFSENQRLTLRNGCQTPAFRNLLASADRRFQRRITSVEKVPNPEWREYLWGECLGSCGIAALRRELNHELGVRQRDGRYLAVAAGHAAGVFAHQCRAERVMQLLRIAHRGREGRGTDEHVDRSHLAAPLAQRALQRTDHVLVAAAVVA